jgi:hypothetical protein
VIFRLACTVGSPSMIPELTLTPSPEKGLALLGRRTSAGLTTVRMGSPNFTAKA